MPDDKPKRRTIRKHPQVPVSPAALAQPPKEPTAFFQHVLALTNRRAEVNALVAGELTRLQPGSEDGTASTLMARAERQATLQALRTWQNEATARLGELRSGRTGSDPAAQPIPAARQAEAVKLTRRLVVGLSKNAARISTLEAADQRWHAAAKAAREAIRLRTDTPPETIGRRLRPDAQLHLKLAHSTFMLEGNSPRLRNELKEGVALNPKSKGLKYWLARYEIMTRNYTAAHEAAVSVADYAPVRQLVMPMLEPETTQAPWLTWP